MLLIDFATITICICILKFKGGGGGEGCYFLLHACYIYVYLHPEKDFGIKSKHSTVTSNQIG